MTDSWSYPPPWEVPGSEQKGQAAVKQWNQVRNDLVFFLLKKNIFAGSVLRLVPTRGIKRSNPIRDCSYNGQDGGEGTHVWREKINR